RRPAPVGMGAHPYLHAGPGGVDSATVQLPAGTRLQTDDRGIPTGRAAVDGTRYDFRRPRPVADQVLDTAYTDLVPDPDGLVRVRVTRSDGRQVALWTDSGWPYLQVFTGDTLPAPQ